MGVWLQVYITEVTARRQASKIVVHELFQWPVRIRRQIRCNIQRSCTRVPGCSHLVLVLRLYQKLVYRLALYQVLASLFLGMVELLQILMIKLQDNLEVYNRVCIAIGFFGMYFQWVKLLFTMWLTFHLFCFAVLYKNLKKLEVLYVVTSLLVPAVIAVVPLITKSYGYSPVDGCYIPVYDDNNTRLLVAAIETFVLWDGPAMVILLALSAAMVVMVIKLTYRVCWRIWYEPITEGDQYWKALNQLLPLATFPILFFVFILPVFVYDIYYSFSSPTPDNTLVLTAYIFIALWSVASGITLIVHISVAQLTVCRRRCTKLLRMGARENSNHQNLTAFGNTVRLESGEPVNSATSFPLPTDGLTSTFQ